MTSLRLLADDLTGALDSAAEFIGLTGPVRAFWPGAVPAVLPANAALDSGTREHDPSRAIAALAALMPHLSAGTIAFKKIDSLLRGPTIAELAACARAWERCVVAPAFPFQGRVTRAGRHYARQTDGGWEAVGPDIVAALRAHGAEALIGHPDTNPRPGINIFDAETDDDLRRIVASVRGPVLWCGTGGLAQALAAGQVPPAPRPLTQPILGLFGSDHATTAGQLAACGTLWTELPDGGPASAERVVGAMAGAGVALVSFALPADMPRDQAADRIARHTGDLARTLPPPGTLIVAGGETLRGLCVSLGATGLDVRGRIVPGVPWSVIVGGRWNGATVVSKSGAFGHPHLLRDLILERTAP